MTRRIPLEIDEAKVLAQYLNARGLRWAHVANERKTTPRRGAELKAIGVKPGVPDVLIFTAPAGRECVGVAIELKRISGGIVSADQQDWLDALKDEGWHTVVARGAAEAIATIERLYPR